MSNNTNCFEVMTNEIEQALIENKKELQELNLLIQQKAKDLQAIVEDDNFDGAPYLMSGEFCQNAAKIALLLKTQEQLTSQLFTVQILQNEIMVGGK